MRACGLALGVCIGLALFGETVQVSVSQTLPGPQPPGSVAGRAPEASDAASPPTLEAVAIAPLACGGAAPWTEAKAITQTGRATRSGNRLAVGGMTFTDTRARDGRPAASFSYVGVFGDSGLDLVQVARGESSAYLLIDATKRSRAELGRFPVPSPTSRYFAVATPAGPGAAGGIEIVERTSGGVKPAVTIPRTDLVDDPCRLTNLTWLSDDRFQVRAARPGSKGPGVAVTYRLSGGKWKPAT